MPFVLHKLYRLVIAFGICALIQAQDSLDISKYPGWAAVMETEGYSWKPYTVYTEDGWTLSLFRIMKEEQDGQEDQQQSRPILVQHGAFMDA